jgi:hypothetical protein
MGYLGFSILFCCSVCLNYCIFTINHHIWLSSLFILLAQDYLF